MIAEIKCVCCMKYRHDVRAAFARVQVPSAKASILWLVGEYCTLVPKIGPDVLRKCAKTFITEVNILRIHNIFVYLFVCLYLLIRVISLLEEK